MWFARGGGSSSASDRVWFSNFLSRAVDTSVANEPVATAHSHTALPRSSNLTRPLLFRATPVGWAPEASRARGLGFEFSSLTIPLLGRGEFSSTLKPPNWAGRHSRRRLCQGQP